jgi:AcrR family transcriptional regulator
VGRAALYLHFANKDGILLALVTANMRGVLSIFRQLCELQSPDLVAVKGWLRDYADAISAHRDAVRLFHVGLANDPSARRMIDDHRDAIVDMFADAFSRLDRDDPQTRTRIILTLARVDYVASVAAEDEPRLDVGVAFDLVAAELAALFSSSIE